MKKIDSDLLDMQVFQDISKKKNYVNEDGSPGRCRDLMKVLVDTPSKEAMTRQMSRALDKAYASLEKGGDMLMEDVDFDSFKSHVDSLSIPAKGVYDAVYAALESAKDENA